MKYDVFISYRREGGEYTAKIIHDRLTELGYHVFFDVESLRSGQFNLKLFNIIEECTDFISVLSPNSLDRCESENDWVRLEIAHALKKGKNVVPVLLRGFQFPEELPEDIDKIRHQSGLEASTEFFDAFARRLAEFLVTKPKIKSRITQNTLLRKLVPSLLAFVIVFAISFGGYTIYQKMHSTFPATKSEKNTVNELVYYVSSNLSQTNIAMQNYENALKKIKIYLASPDESQKKSLKVDITNYQANILKAQQILTKMDDNLSNKIDQTPLPKEDVLALYDYLYNIFTNLSNDITYLYSIIDQNYFTVATISEVEGYYEEEYNQEDDLIFYGVNEMFLSVNDSSLKDFKNKILPTLSCIYTNQSWLSDKDEIEAISNAAMEKMENAIMDYSALIGDKNASVDQLKNDINQLQQTQDLLDKTKAEAKEKFKPLDTDDVDTLWGKMLRFNRLFMYDMCIDCLQRYQLKATDTAEAAVYVPIAINFYNQVVQTGVNYGAMVLGFEPGKPKHSFYQLGDVIISLNDKKVQVLDDYFNIVKGLSLDEQRKVVVLRYNGKQFVKVTGTFNSSEPKILLNSMSEGED